MTPQERELIQGLFDRIAETSGPRDPEAERLIADETRTNPAAAYYLAQAVLVQEEALKAADARIRELEAAAEKPKPSGGFLSGISPWGPRPGSRDEPRTIDAPPPGYGRRDVPPPLPGQSGGYGPPGSYAAAQQQQGGPQQGGNDGRPSFLRGAMTTAAGVAGGALLFSGISSLMGGNGLFGGGNDHSAGQGVSGANWSNESSGAQDNGAQDRGDISNFDREGFHNASSQDSEWDRQSDGGAVHDASWSDDDGGDWGSSDEI